MFEKLIMTMQLLGNTHLKKFYFIIFTFTYVYTLFGPPPPPKHTFWGEEKL
jgi:hypothetical protein